MQKLVYGKNFGHVIRPLARSRKNVDELFEQASIKEEWDKIVALRQNELMKEQVKSTGPETEEKEEETARATMRKPPTEFTENSMAYWTALAKTSVRRFIPFAVMPSTKAQTQRLVSQCALKDISLNQGSKCFGCNTMFLKLSWTRIIFWHEQMGETLGPNGQVGLRRNPTDASGKFRLLMHGLLVARCAQIGEATIPAPTEISCSNPKSGRYFA